MVCCRCERLQTRRMTQWVPRHNIQHLKLRFLRHRCNWCTYTGDPYLDASNLEQASWMILFPKQRYWINNMSGLLVDEKIVNESVNVPNFWHQDWDCLPWHPDTRIAAADALVMLTDWLIDLVHQQQLVGIRINYLLVTVFLQIIVKLGVQTNTRMLPDINKQEWPRIQQLHNPPPKKMWKQRNPPSPSNCSFENKTLQFLWVDSLLSRSKMTSHTCLIILSEFVFFCDFYTKMGK